MASRRVGPIEITCRYIGIIFFAISIRYTIYVSIVKISRCFPLPIPFMPRNRNGTITIMITPLIIQRSDIREIDLHCTALYRSSRFLYFSLFRRQVNSSRQIAGRATLNRGLTWELNIVCASLMFTSRIIGIWPQSFFRCNSRRISRRKTCPFGSRGAPMAGFLSCFREILFRRDGRSTSFG